MLNPEAELPLIDRVLETEGSQVSLLCNASLAVKTSAIKAKRSLEIFASRKSHACPVKQFGSSLRGLRKSLSTLENKFQDFLREFTFIKLFFDIIVEAANNKNQSFELSTEGFPFPHVHRAIENLANRIKNGAPIESADIDDLIKSNTDDSMQSNPSRFFRTDPQKKTADVPYNLSPNKKS